MLVSLDSSVLIALAKESDPHHASCTIFFNRHRHTFTASILAVVESLYATYVKGYEMALQAKLDLEERLDAIVEITYATGYLALKLIAESGLRTSDAIICATGELSDAQLWTCDKDLVKKFPKAQYVGA